MSGVYPHQPPSSQGATAYAASRRFSGEDSKKPPISLVMDILGSLETGYARDAQVFLDYGSIAINPLPGNLGVEVLALVGDSSVAA